MTIHREGYSILAWSAVIFVAINLLLFNFCSIEWINYSVLALCIIFYILFLQFFRYPKRDITRNEKYVVCPADGKVVVIEQTVEDEYFKDKRIQVSVFMSPINVHANWYPMSGLIKYARYHKGKYLVAWHPKASTENERTTIVLEKDEKRSILIRQVAGALAKRIIYYPHEGDKVTQGAELGFIKFGSRVDIYLPLHAKVNVNINEVVKGGVTVLAELS